MAAALTSASRAAVVCPSASAGSRLFSRGAAVSPLRATPRVAQRARMAAPPAAFFGSKSTPNEGIYAITATDIDGRPVPLSKYKGKALLIVNSASACGFTPQQKDLADLAKQFKGKLEVLLQPCNQFGGQDPGSNSQIKQFAAGNGIGGGNGVMLAKADVNGGDASPLFAYLKAQKGGLLTSDIKWNFTKFLVSPKGEVVGRYPPTTPPDALVGDIEKALASA